MVTQINAVTNAAVANIPVGQRPWGIAVSPDGGKVFVANSNSSSVSFIDTATNTAAPAVGTESGAPRYVAFSNDGSTAYVTISNISRVLSYDVPSGKKLPKTLSVGSIPNGIAVAPETVAPGTPGKPAGVATGPGDGQVQLSWTAPSSDGGSPVDHHEIVPRVAGVDQAPISTPSAATAFTVSGLTNGQTYSFKVAAANAKGAGAQSSPFSLHLPTPPSAPTGLQAITADSQVRLSWDPPSDDGGLPILGYEIVRHTGAVETKTVIPAIDHKLITGLANGESYSFTVAAITDKWQGAESATLPVELPAVPERPAWQSLASLTALVGGNAFFGTSTTGAVTPVQTATGAVGQPIAIGSVVRDIALSPSGRTAWVAAGGASGTVTPVDLQTMKKGTPIAVGKEPWGIAISPDGSKLLVANSGANSVTPIDVATMTAGTPIGVGGRPYGIAFSPDGQTALVANNGGGTVTPIDVATMSAGEEIGEIANQPWGVAISPDGSKAYVTSESSQGLVTPIEMATRTAGRRSRRVPTGAGSPSPPTAKRPTSSTSAPTASPRSTSPPAKPPPRCRPAAAGTRPGSRSPPTARSRRPRTSSRLMSPTRPTRPCRSTSPSSKSTPRS